MQVTKIEIPEALKPYQEFLNNYSTLEQAFRNAAVKGELNLIRAIRPFVNVNSAGESGYTALHGACSNGHLKVVLLLLELGARPDLTYKDKPLPFDLLKPKVLKNFRGTIPRKESGFRPEDTIVVNAFNTNGIGDAQHAVRGHLLCRRLVPYVPCKTIITLDKSALKPLLKAIDGDVQLNDIYIVNTDAGVKGYNDDKAEKAQFVFFVAQDLINDDGGSKFPTYYFIYNHAPKLKNFLKRTRQYLNFATKLSDVRNVPTGSIAPGKTYVYSFLEFGGPSNKMVHADALLSDMELYKKVFNETEMGLFNGQTGMMVDESLNDLMQCLSADQLQSHDFTNPLLYELIVKQEGHLAVGYLQHAPVLCFVIASLAAKSPSLRLLTNLHLITPSKMKSAPFKDFAKIQIFDAKGNIVQEYQNDQAKFATLSLFPFEGMSNQDKRRYLIMADSTLGSGDNSFMECITAGKPFFWDMQMYKQFFTSKLGIWCCNHGLLNLAKMIYLNNFLCTSDMGLVKPIYLATYTKFLQENWAVICQETQQFRQHILRNANFSDQLAALLKYPQTPDKQRFISSWD